MKTSTLVKVAAASVAMLLIAVGVMAQGARGKGGRKGVGRPRAAIIAVGKENRLEFAGDKAKVMRAMQQSFKKVRERAVVTDMELRLFGKLNYLAVHLEGPRKILSTLFFELAPNTEGTAYHTNGPHVVTCVVDQGCTKTCVLVPETNTNLPDCYCPASGGDPGCNFKINKLYIGELVDDFNYSLLAIGFEPAKDENTPREESTPKSNNLRLTPRPKH
jgi:hypothetical protein